jgi:hypothetical protein
VTLHVPCSSIGRCPAGGAVELDELLTRSGVLRLLVVTPTAGEPRKPHRESTVILELPPAGGVIGRQRELGAEHFEHQARLEPHICRHARVDPRGPLGPDQGRQSCRQRGKFGVEEPSAAPADGLIETQGWISKVRTSSASPLDQCLVFE